MILASPQTAPVKTQKPYAEFPLTPHPNGQWCKKIRGRLHYFEAWGDWEAALNLFLDQKKRPPRRSEPTNRVGMLLGTPRHGFSTHYGNPALRHAPYGGVWHPRSVLPSRPHTPAQAGCLIRL